MNKTNLTFAYKILQIVKAFFSSLEIFKTTQPDLNKKSLNCSFVAKIIRKQGLGRVLGPSMFGYQVY